MSVASLVKSQKALHEQLTKAIDNYTKTKQTKHTESYLQTRIESFNSIWNKFQQNHVQIYEKETGDADAYLKSTLFETTEELYIDYISQFKEELKAFTTQSSSNTPANTSPQYIPKNDIQLPRITIPSFDGSYSSWRSFHDLFKSIVHKDPHLSKVQKLHYLKTSVTGEAERLLRQFDITDSNYQKAWEFLDKRYNNKRMLVNTQLKLLLNQPVIKTESSQAIKAIIDQTEESLHELEALGIRTKNWDAMLIYILIQKLPNETHCLWEQEQGTNTEIPSYKDFMTFLESRFRTLEALQNSKDSKAYSTPLAATKNNSNHNSSKSKGTYTFLNKSLRCCKCNNNNHNIYRCPKFKGLAPTQRIEFAKQKGLCKNCLSYGHNVLNCRSKKTCLKCHKKHHTLLHLELFSKSSPGTALSSNPHHSQSPKRDQTNEAPHSESTQNFFSTHIKRAILSTALVKVQGPSGYTDTLRALIDSGSQVSFITESACRRLQLKLNSADVRITGLGKTNTAHAQKQVSFKINSIHSKFEAHMQALVLRKISDSIPIEPIDTSCLNFINKLPLADPQFSRPGPIDLLLGADIYGKIIENGVIKSTDNLPTAQYTQLGWILMGSINQKTSNHAIKTFTTQIEPSLDKLEWQLRQFWETEEVQEPIKLSKEDEQCEQHYQSTHRRRDDGRYEVALPFKNTNKPEFGQSRHIAVKQFLQLERKFAQRPELHEAYKQCIHEYVKLGHAKEISPQTIAKEYNANNVNHFYLPHHAVFKDSSTTKLRVVFNASSKSANGKSLNDELLIGPTIQPTLWATLLKWRQYKYAMTADIEKMYRMIDIQEEQQNYQRIIWRDNPNEKLRDFKLTTVTFGTAPAPFLAIRTLHQLAHDEKDNFPMAAESLKSEFYVDDLLTGAHTIEEGLQRQGELIVTLNKGGFNLRKWTTNHPQLIKNIPIENRELKDSLQLSENDSIKTLGIKWFPATDHFSFSVKLPALKSVYTKRTILSDVASLFDPLGWIAPCVITAKILMQRLWLSKCTWDEKLPQPITQEWISFREELNSLQMIKIPRWTKFIPNAAAIELHGFCDASNHAYAAVVYLKVAISDSLIHTSLLASKTRVAPTKTTSLPRLELCGALLLAKLLAQIQSDMNLSKIPIFAWTDSSITLAWIHGQPTKWKVYVANRVAKIQDRIPPSSWRHVPSKDNPADCASRGLSPKLLLTHDLWWQGPKWLKQQNNNWPEQPNLIVPNIEVKQVVTLLNKFDEEFPLLTKFSKFLTVIRVTAYCLRFILNCKKSATKCTTKFLTVSELKAAEIKIIQMTQAVTFADEINRLKNNRPLSNKSRILCLNPFIGSEQVLRVGGRLENSPLNYNQKHPIILPNNHHISNLIIDYIHKYTLHGGTQLVLNTLRNKYWLLNARNTIRHRIHKCIPCFKVNPKTSQQIMSDLPSSRVNPALPFQHTGVDYAGPISIKSSKLRNAKIIKGYLSIFICMTTKAIHIEIVTDLSTTAFLAAFKRFISRRGTCSDIYSDCGTNFVGACKILDQDLKIALKNMPEEIAQQMANQGIKWHFNPPSAPHFGGLWEAGVKSVKTHMKKVLQNTTLTYEELSTVTCQIEACVNSRPLSPLSNDPNDYNVLTPGHFLTGRNIMAIPEPTLIDSEIPIKRWQYIQYLTQQFWRKWALEYLHNLQQRTKWQTQMENLQINDLVLIKDDRYPPTKWPLGRITEIHSGKDNKIRVATIKTENNSVIRPIIKLCRLPCDYQGS